MLDLGYEVDVKTGVYFSHIQGCKLTGAFNFLQLVVCDSPVGRLGLTVCYDLRFPEVYQRLTYDMGAQVLLVPSAFTKVTGAPGLSVSHACLFHLECKRDTNTVRCNLLDDRMHSPVGFSQKRSV